MTTAAAAAVAAANAPRAFARQGGLTVHFVGMMGFVERTDGSLLAVTPGHHPMQHFPHVPFAMARAGSPIAKALGMQPGPGVVPGAFDTRVMDAGPDDFVFLCLEHSSIDIVAADAKGAVDNQADWLAQMHVIRPGKRTRGDLRRWSHATASLEGGRLVNAVAHPDAGKVWSIGAHKQRLTDAVDYHAGAGVLRLGAGRSVRTFAADDGAASEIWFVSSAGPRMDQASPKRLTHAELLSHYLVGADPIVPECEEATGRDVPATGLPCGVPTVASLRGVGAAVFPPYMDLCIQAYYGDGGGV